ncbi:MAG: Gfo/Idh/MocA family protein [Candidatus Sumerlaeia bacterium]
MAKKKTIEAGKVKLGIVGVGGMGSNHANRIMRGDVPNLELAAVCDIDPERLKGWPEEVETFDDSKTLIRSGKVDAILVATPHYGHTTIGIDGLKNGLHVLVEKPISVHVADAQKLIDAYKETKNQIFCAMFNQRTDPRYQKVKALIEKGELGEIMRVNWIITNWYRPEAYYASGGWRATWEGEGGGVLLNQCPHNLDLFQWMLGMMPSKMQAKCHLGKYHNIEVEDEVTAYMEFPNGATGVFITSTGEAPGSNRLEIMGDRGKIIVENGIHFTRTVDKVSEFTKTTKQKFGSPETWNIEIPIHNHGEQHNGILKNFVGAILNDDELLAPAEEGIKAVELANAMLFSSFKGKEIDLPIDAKAYERQLKKLIKESTFVKEVEKVDDDMDSSFVK